MTLNVGTYEAQIIELLGDQGNVIRYTVAATTAISKGTLMTFGDPRTAIKSGAGTFGVSIPIAGIASVDKQATDGSTTMGCYTYGIFEFRTQANSTIDAGDAVAISGANNQIIKAVTADAISGAILGVALENATANEEISVLVKL